jgi:hypothetical protein
MKLTLSFWLETVMTFGQAVAALPSGRFLGDVYRAPCPAHEGEAT